jgi:ribosomal protein L11 methyltransferase
MRFLDVGCGSGILSVLAYQMGASFIKAIDYDAVAVENCRENFTINKVTIPHQILESSLDVCVGDEPYHFICANIIRSTILEMLPELITLTSPGGFLVLSGLLDKDITEVTDTLELYGQNRIQIHPDNEWRTLIITRS